MLIQESSVERDNIKDPFTEVSVVLTWILQFNAFGLNFLGVYLEFWDQIVDYFG